MTQDNTNTLQDTFGPVIHSYTRAQAIEDGVLVDVTETAQESGFKFPVAMTSRLFEEVITPDPRAEELGQSVSGRLWDALHMLRCSIGGRMGARVVEGPGPGQTTYYKCYFIMKRKQRKLLELKAVCGPGDDMEPTITIMLPEED
jgi:hypothetical protein